VRMKSVSPRSDGLKSLDTYITGWFVCEVWRRFKCGLEENSGERRHKYFVRTGTQ
jgi:hypothetical protein